MVKQKNSMAGLEAKFWQLLEHTEGSARERLLGAVRDSEPEMAAELEKMLAAHGKVADFLELADNRELNWIGRVVATIDSHPTADRASTHVPDTIGIYKLLEPIGEGGMGLVYLAQQSKPVRRKVALKVIKPGMDSRQVSARFEAERQALAMMDHPNIAKVFDAGTTDQGHPYFVMELVRGIPITEYCDRGKMPVRQRLELFCEACRAVQHAHNKGIIHRDIKPSNVLVTEDDGTPMVKVIDFGVAKALTGNLTDKTMYTGVFQMIGTPLYMSPEQASLSNFDVDTRSDVYSLGVLLYELITGMLPIDRESIKEMNYEQLRRHIESSEPVRPSRRLSTLKDELETIAERRGLDLRQIKRHAGNELDWIVMKAIEKDRSRRYQAARELAEDVQCYLEGKAVQACPPSIGYKLSKTYRRHRVLLVSTVGLLVVLLCGVAGTGWQAYRATLAERDSEKRLEALVDEQSKTQQALAAAEEAERQQRRLRKRAEASEQAAKWRLYVANLYPMRAAWRDGNFGKLHALLEGSLPTAEEEDYRGWEWYYLRSQVRGQFQTLRFGDVQPEGPFAWCQATRELATVARSGKQEVVVWDFDRSRKLWTVAMAAPSQRMRFSPDGRFLAVGTGDGRLQMINCQTRETSLTERISPGRPSQHIEAISWEPDGNRVAFASYFGTIAIYDLRSRQLEFLRRPETLSYCGGLDWHPHDDLLAAGLRWGERRIYDLSNQTSARLSDASESVGHGVAWSPSGELLAVSYGERIRVLDRRWRKVVELAGHFSEIQEIEWLDDSTLISAANDHTVRAWDVETATQTVLVSAHTEEIHSLEIDREQGACFSSNRYEAEIKRIKLSPGEPFHRKQMSSGERFGVKRMTWSPDGSMLAATGWNKDGRSTAVWTADGGTPVAVLDCEDSRGLQWSRDGTRLFRFDRRGVLGIVDPLQCIELNSRFVVDSTGQNIGRSVGRGVLSPDRSRILQVNDGGYFLNATEDLQNLGRMDQVFNTPTAEEIVWSPDGTQAFCGGYGTPLLLRTTEGISKRRVPSTPCKAAAWHPSKPLLALGRRSGAICFVDTSENRQLLEGPGHRGQVEGADISPDGRRLATCGSDNTVVIWDTATGDELLRLDWPTSDKAGSVAWSPDGLQLAASTTEAIYVWSVDPEFEPGLSRGFLPSGTVYQQMTERDPETTWALPTAPAAWKSWYGKLQACSVNTLYGEADNQLLEKLFRDAQPTEWIAIKSALRNWLEDQASSKDTIGLADPILRTLQSLDLTLPEFYLTRIAVLRAKTRHLQSLERFEEAMTCNEQTVALATVLIDHRKAEAEHWRIWESAQVDSAGLIAAQLQKRATVDDGSDWNKMLEERFQAIENVLTRFPSWARLIDPEAGAESRQEAWKFAFVDPSVERDLEAGRIPDFIGVWAERFGEGGYYDLYQRALCYALQGEEDRYHEICKQMLERYVNSKEVLESSFTIWSCALLPGCLDDYESLLRIAERTVANHPENASVQRHQAAVQFRAGQVAAARDAFMQLSDETPEASSPAYAWLFLAMVEKQQGDDEAAKTWYQRADSHIMKQRKRAQSGKLDIPWNRLATLTLLHNEASQVLNGGTANDGTAIRE